MREVAALLKAIDSWAARRPWLLHVVVFGSRVRGGYRPDSDLDVFVRTDPDFSWYGIECDWQTATLNAFDDLGRQHGFSVNTCFENDQRTTEWLRLGTPLVKLATGKLRFILTQPRPHAPG